jgi:hypothetical protein
MSDILDKYTIFDNFDKLDLSPVAGLIHPDALTNLNPVSSLSTDVNNIEYNTYNETVFFNLNGKGRPIAYDSKDMASGAVPDMFWYITNNRFYIRSNGSIFHTSQIKSQLSTGAKDFFDDFLLDSNIFYNQFFFNIFLNNFAPIFSDAVKLYKNPFFSPGFENVYDNSIENYFLSKNGSLVDNFTQLAEYSPIGNNIPTFFKPEMKDHTDYKLLVDNLFTPANPNYKSVLSSVGPDPDELGGQSIALRNQALLFLQRLLYPYKTETGRVPKHNYFVSNLEKSTSVGMTGKYNYTPPANPQNVSLEWQLPNIYAYHSYLSEKEYSAVSNYYKEIVSLDHEGEIKLDNFSLNKYYEISSNSQDHLNVVDSGDSEEYSKFYKLLRHQTTIFGYDYYEKHKAVKAVKHLFPIYSEIKLPPTKSDLMQALDSRFNAADKLIDLFMAIISSYFSSFDVYKRSEVHTFSLHDKHTDGTNISLTDLQVLDLDAFGYNMLDLLYLHSNRFAFSDTSLVRPGNKPLKNETSLQISKVEQIKEIIFNYSSERTLSYDDLRIGEKCYSEILAFEVVKYGFIDGIKTRLQSFFIPCHSETGKNLVDTQVFYDKEYIYEVFSISLVVGSEYTSELAVADKDIQSPESFNKNNLIKSKYDTSDMFVQEIESIELAPPPGVIAMPGPSTDQPILSGGPQYEATPKPILVRAPYYNTLSIIGKKEQKNIIILDKPPLAPDISFTPYKDVDDKVLVTLGVNYGKRRLQPVQVFPEDLDQIQKHFQSQKNIVEDTPFDQTLDSFLKPLNNLLLTYQTDDFRGTYKIWRTTQKPLSWGAFYNSTPVEIDNRENTAFQDDILPNVDYYYFARFEDKNGNFSNPTDIFYLRMVKEGGFPPYLIVKTYNFLEGRPPFVYEKSFKKYLKIRLADDTREYYNVNDLNKIDFGYKKANSTNELKKYKIRITSKKTGKKLDINVDFNKKISNQYLNGSINKSATATDTSVPTEPIGDESTPTAYTTEEGLFVDPVMLEKQTNKLEESSKAIDNSPETKSVIIDGPGFNIG